MNEQDKIEALRKIPLFSEVGRRDLKRIAEAAVERRYAAGAEIVAEGERGVAMFIIVNGEVEATKRSAEGPLTLSRLGPGAYFGELALFGNHPRNATIRATSAVECLAITEWDFKAELRTDPAIAMQMLQTTVRRLRETTQKLAEAQGGDVDLSD